MKVDHIYYSVEGYAQARGYHPAQIRVRIRNGEIDARRVMVNPESKRCTYLIPASELNREFPSKKRGPRSEETKQKIRDAHKARREMK